LTLYSVFDREDAKAERWGDAYGGAAGGEFFLSADLRRFKQMNMDWTVSPKA
jgi:hypothetical protein